MEVYLSIAIVAIVEKNMTTDTTEDEAKNTCPIPEDAPEGSVMVSGYDWSEQTQAFNLGAFFLGTMATNFPGGRAAEYLDSDAPIMAPKYSADTAGVEKAKQKRSSLTLEVKLDILKRKEQGEGTSTISRNLGPAQPTVWMVLRIIGNIVAMSVGVWLCSTTFLGGWPSVFYVFGGLGVIWAIPWFLLIHDLPEHHPRISDAELQFILEHRHYTKRDKNGFSSALPYVMMIFTCVSWGIIVDILQKKKVLSVNAVRKLSTSLGLYSSGACLIGMMWVNCDSTVAMVVMCLALGFMRPISSGFHLSEQDIAPNLAGTLKGLTNTMGSTTAFVAIAITGAITNDNQTMPAWNTVFVISAVFNFIFCTIYVFLGTDKVQPWNDSEPKKLRQLVVMMVLPRSEDIHKGPTNSIPDTDRHKAIEDRPLTRKATVIGLRTFC
ncbi:putative inorganic phosphate cotransporter [Portunus trituberculatus]|uniref:Putative inorganic phosphate cotransporter n=1 Tax=Portunus trituberculatus TaxID=210409 RepID=A0A5B7D7V8_PORTR|nr:putative inorganic phosphate cotransporter [Portunus trituberculatus]